MSRTKAPWSKSEEAILIKAYAQGRSIEEIARAHLRKSPCILQKLTELHASRRLAQIREEDFEGFIDDLASNYTAYLERFLEEECANHIRSTNSDEPQFHENESAIRPNCRAPDRSDKGAQEFDGQPLQPSLTAVDLLATLAADISVSKTEITRIVNERDETAACLHLGLAFEYGFGLPASLTEASKWYFLGARFGDSECDRLYERSLRSISRNENSHVVIRGTGNHVSDSYTSTSDWSESLDDLDQEYWERHLGGPDDAFLEEQERRLFETDDE